MALDLLKSAVDSAKNEKIRIAMLEEVASLNTQVGDFRSAVDCFQKLSELRPNDMSIMCRLIKAYATFDPRKAEELSAKIFPRENNSYVNVDALEISDTILYGERYRQKKETKPEIPDAVCYLILPFISTSWEL